jgi:5-methyltetrahydropteroyltriglutamate--homocysteine methyltransferase
MRRSSDRILTSHAGALPRPADFLAVWSELPASEAAMNELLPGTVRAMVRRQTGLGIDVVNDGEISKRGFSHYIADRMTGIEQHPWPAGQGPTRGPVNGRDRRDFPDFYSTGPGAALSPIELAAARPVFAVSPLKYTGHEAVARDIANLKAAVAGLDVEPFLPGIAPGTVEHWLWNEYYADDEEFLFAIADVLHEEFKAITDAGIILQIDDPDLPDGWQMFPDWDLPTYRSYAELRVAAINRAIEGLPEELIRFHVCWGSQHGPHYDDIPLREFVDLVLKVNAQCYSVEGANPRHEHEWAVFKDVPLPEGKILMPGVVSHASDIIEHPQVVADRIVRYASVVGRENVIAGTDCGLAGRVGSPEIAWAKLRALSDGAALATRELWRA